LGGGREGEGKGLKCGPKIAFDSVREDLAKKKEVTRRWIFFTKRITSAKETASEYLPSLNYDRREKARRC